jgi:hypothetical protein
LTDGIAQRQASYGSPPGIRKSMHGTAHIRITGVEFVNTLREYYETDRIYQLKEQHDAYVTGHILKTEFKGAWASLSTHQATQNNHPQAQSPTAEWWDHCKGPRKKTGRSPENTA